MDVEDLIASMHVGREGYELKALQVSIDHRAGFETSIKILIVVLSAQPCQNTKRLPNSTCKTAFRQIEIHS
jgi:hypothetical protein